MNNRPARRARAKGEDMSEQQGKKVSETSITMGSTMLPQDANHMGNVHGGVVMKHIDATGGVVAMRHAGRMVVTASIDRLDFHHPVYVGDLLILKACVNHVGSTSMEVGVRVEAETLPTGKPRHTASAYLTYVALDENGGPCQVPPLIVESPAEQRRYDQAVDRRSSRLAEKKRERAARDK